MKRMIRLFGAALLCAALWVPAAWAGEGQATSKNAAEQTVTIDGRAYHVSDKTILRDQNGELLRFKSLPLTREGSRRELDPVQVSFDAVDTRHGQTLVSLQIVGTPE